MLCFTFLTVAPAKLLGQQGWLQRFAEWGYSPRFASGVGMLELVGAGLLLFPSLAFYGAGLLVVVMAGATWTHLSTGIGSPAFSLQLLLLAAAVAALRYPDARGVRPEPSASDQTADPAAVDGD
jgi:hypothetical protein